MKQECRAIVLLSDVEKWKQPGLTAIMKATEHLKPDAMSAIEFLRQKQASDKGDENETSGGSTSDSSRVY